MGKRGGTPLCIGALVPHMVALDKIFFFFNSKVLIFSYFFTKTYVVGIHWKHLIEALLMSTHNICFRGEVRKIFTWYPPLSKPIPSYPSYYQIYLKYLDTYTLRFWTRSFYWSTLVAKSLVLLDAAHEVLGSNHAWGIIQLITLWHVFAWIVYLTSPGHPT